MLILRILRWLLLIVEICFAGPILYLCILSVSAILAAKKRKAENTKTSSEVASPPFNFALLVPAYNEEMVLGTLLESLATLAYPEEQYSVYVVADNCTDNTAELARGTSRVRVYERFDEDKRGKGYALNWLLRRLEEDQLIHDAYVIFDADSVVEPNFLQAMVRELKRGARALQGCVTVLNASESPTTALRWIALTLMIYLRPLGRNGLGASSTLNGNGMCLSRKVLMHYPWLAFSIGEDYQYYLTLIEHGEKVRFVPDAVVRSQMPTTFRQLRTQDIRWESDISWESAEGIQATWRIAGRLLRAGLRYRDFARIEAVAELLTPPLSLLVCGCMLTLIASLLVGSLLELLLSLILIGGLSCYVGTGLYLLRPQPSVYRALLHAPGFIIWKLWVYFVLRRSKKHVSEWVRTSRTAS